MPEATTVEQPTRKRPALDTTSNAALAERVERLERVVTEMATAVAGVSQAGRWVFNEFFEQVDGRVVLR